jgi:hypothetical protein
MADLERRQAVAVLELAPQDLSRGLNYPNHGYPANPGEDRPGLSPFGRLAYGQPLGKSTLLQYNADDDQFQPSPVDILRIEGDDLDATQLIVTLACPRVIPFPFDDLIVGDQNLTGEVDNSEISAGNFPGTVAPIRWPPIEVVIEWGVRGAQARAIVDFVNGMTISVVASFLNVKAAITQSSPDTIQGTSGAYYLAGFAGPGFAKGNARRTIYIGDVDVNTESAVFDVPKFASKVTLVGHDTSVVPNVTVAFVRFFQSPDGTNNVGNFFVSGNVAGPFDIPNGAAYFSLFSQSGIEMPFSAVFELALT